MGPQQWLLPPSFIYRSRLRSDADSTVSTSSQYCTRVSGYAPFPLNAHLEILILWHDNLLFMRRHKSFCDATAIAVRYESERVQGLVTRGAVFAIYFAHVCQFNVKEKSTELKLHGYGTIF